MKQIDIIKQQLLDNGEISRNWCLKNYISRLGAYIVDLKKQGWEFKTEQRGGDYVYKLIKKPEITVPTKEVKQEQARLFTPEPILF